MFHFVHVINSKGVRVGSFLVQADTDRKASDTVRMIDSVMDLPVGYTLQSEPLKCTPAKLHDGSTVQVSISFDWPDPAPWLGNRLVLRN